MKSEKVDSEDSFIDSDDESLFNQENLHTYENSDKKARRSLSQKNTAIKSRYMEESRKQASQMTSDERESQRCSFKPCLFKPVRSTTTAEIYGLENFLSNVDRARKLQLDKKYQNQKVSSSKYLWFCLVLMIILTVMNPATDIIRRVFPSYSQPSMAASKSSSHSACQSPNPQPKTSLGGDSA